jgi:hypothetical protein
LLGTGFRKGEVFGTDRRFAVATGNIEHIFGLA